MISVTSAFMREYDDLWCDPLLGIRGGGRLRDALLRLPFVGRGRLRSYWVRLFENFGDQLSPAILEYATGCRPTYVTRRYRGKILGIGSILQAVPAEGDIVWGSGALEDQPFEAPTGVTFLAVRGPLTRGLIRGAEVPEVYGDPACLLPLFYNPSIEKRYRLGVVPHFRDFDMAVIDDPATKLIDVRDEWRRVVDQILACDVIISSSLHGLITAESYGIPASWAQIGDSVPDQSDFKYQDYYLATGRDRRSPTRWTRGLDQLVRNCAPPPVFDPRPLLAAARRLPGLERE